MKRKRETTTFNLSFLDVMSCGFGAVVLIFLIVDHADSTQVDPSRSLEVKEVALLERDIELEKDLIEQARNAELSVDENIVEVSAESKLLRREVSRLREELAEENADTLSKEDHINQLKTDIKTLEEKIQRLRSEAEEGQGQRSRFIYGDGERQYLTGLRLGGKRTLILFDASASMLDRTVVNILRLRNTSPAQQRQAQKWLAAVGALDWLTAQLPIDGEYQIYAFNTETRSVLEGTDGQWLPVDDTPLIEDALQSVRAITPAGGTSLINAFETVDNFTRRPDNIILMTDGLPTQGRKPGKGQVNSQKRMKFFTSALRSLPGGIPVNVILAPMEGDPLAAAAFWQLAARTQGSFLSPSKDWP